MMAKLIFLCRFFVIREPQCVCIVQHVRRIQKWFTFPDNGPMVGVTDGWQLLGSQNFVRSLLETGAL